MEVSVDTRVERRKDTSGYREFHDGDIRVLVSKDLADYASQVHIDTGTMLWFFHFLKADADLPDGLRISRGLPRASQ